MSLGNYRFLPHTADAKFQAFGDTLEEAFTNAALATASLMWDWKQIERKTEHRVLAEGRDLKQLLVSFPIFWLLKQILFADSALFKLVYWKFFPLGRLFALERLMCLTVPL